MKKFIFATLIVLTHSTIFAQSQQDSINVKQDPESSVTYGEGNNTFKVTPQMLSRLLAKNPTVEMVEATFSKWHASPVSKYPAAGGAVHEKRYTLGTLSHGVKVEFDSKRKVSQIIITDFSDMELKSFYQSLVSFGFRTNASTSNMANKINRGVGGLREYYSKQGSPVTFVLRNNQVVVLAPVKK